MKIAIAKEIDPSEPRVAASPDTVKKFKALGADVAIEPGAGIKSGVPDSDFTAAGAMVSADALKDADIIIKVKRPEACELGALQARRAGDRDHGSLRQRGGAEDDRGRRRVGVRDGTDAAHHARAGDGRAVVAGQPRRLPRGDRGGGGLRPRLPDDDDRGRHRAGGKGVRDGRRRRRPAGDRDRAPARRRGHRDRRAARPRRSRSKSSAPSSSRSRTRNSRTRRPPAATPRKCRKSIRPSRPRSPPSTSRSRTSSSPPR